jgi:tetratricopeptide (TPR) repeat protein
MRTLLYLALCMFSAPSFAQATSPKQQLVNEVMQRVALSFGDYSSPPTVKLLPGKQVIARVPMGSTSEIEMDEYLYDELAKAFGPALLPSALALVLGHELIHVRKNASPTRQTASFGQTGSANEKEEREADLEGMLQAYLAGYDMPKVADSTFRVIYRAYGLSEKLPNYPSLAGRQALLRQTIAEVQKSAPLWEAGKLLFMKQEFAAAAHCYEKLSVTFPAKEVFNNWGVALMAQVVRPLTDHAKTANPTLQASRAWSFAYPLELATQNRLGQQRTGASPTEVTAAEQLFAEAQKKFARALATDPNYEAAAVNLATWYCLDQSSELHFTLALAELEKFKSPADPNVFLLRGIALWGLSRNPEAKEMFDTAERKGAHLAKFNRETFEKVTKGVIDNLWDWLASHFKDYFPDPPPRAPGSSPKPNPWLGPLPNASNTPASVFGPTAVQILPAAGNKPRIDIWEGRQEGGRTYLKVTVGGRGTWGFYQSRQFAPGFNWKGWQEDRPKPGPQDVVATGHRTTYYLYGLDKVWIEVDQQTGQPLQWTCYWNQ